MIGVGLRTKHYSYLLENAAKIDFLEIISENYMDTQGRPRSILRKLREKYPVCMHGVSMSLGTEAGVRRDYLKALKALKYEVEPFFISDHLCLTGNLTHNSHDLLPLSYNNETLKIVTRNINRVQDFLGTEIGIENVSSYLTWKTDTMTEWEFIAAVVRRTGCKLLLDINNIYVNATNHGFDPMDFLKSIDAPVVGEIHVAGFTDMGTHLFDTHSRPVHRNVQKLWARVAHQYPGVPLLLERDDDIPAFPVIEKEILKLGKMRAEAIGGS